MSIVRLIIGIVSLALGLFWMLARDRIRATPDRPNGIHPTLYTMVGPVWLLIGVGWLISAFV